MDTTQTTATTEKNAMTIRTPASERVKVRRENLRDWRDSGAESRHYSDGRQHYVYMLRDGVEYRIEEGPDGQNLSSRIIGRR